MNLHFVIAMVGFFEENDKYIKIFGTYSIDKDDNTIEYG
jgi:hypothetical protein